MPEINSRREFESRGPKVFSPGDAITSDAVFRDTFVTYGGKVAISGSRITHDRTARGTGFYYPDIRIADKLVVDDGGEIYDNGEMLVISDYVTESTCPKEVFDVRNGQNNEWADQQSIMIAVRNKTGQVVADATERKVLVQFPDKSEVTFTPRG